MKIYIVIVEDVYDFQITDNKPMAFETYESAKRCFDEAVDAFKTVNPIDNDDDSFKEESWNNHYEYYEDGRFIENHFSVTIHEIELQK